MDGKTAKLLWSSQYIKKDMQYLYQDVMNYPEEEVLDFKAFSSSLTSSR